MRNLCRGIPLPAMIVSACLAAIAMTSAAGRSPDKDPAELRLPPDLVFDKVAGPDGAVVFRHTTHLAFNGMNCAACHPEPFKFLTPERRATHEEMNAGRSCGVCHDGRKASSTAREESCADCHTRWGMPHEVSAGDVVISASADSPAPVRFRHATHASEVGSCAGCHPQPFAVKAEGTLLAPAAGSRHEACGLCHDGKKAFGVEDSDACERCHATQGAAP